MSPTHLLTQLTPLSLFFPLGPNHILSLVELCN